MKTADWTIRAEAGEAEVFLYDEIGDEWYGGISARVFINELQGLPDDVETLTVRINSPGGDVFEGIAIYEALRRWRGTVRVTVDGLAASAASVVAMGGDTIGISPAAMMMVHEPWMITLGNATELRESADLLDKVNDSIVLAYTTREGVEEEAIRQALADETWYGAQEAIDAGLADELTEAVAAAASVRIDAKRYKKTPRQFWGEDSTTRSPKTRHRLENARRRLQLIGMED